MKKSFVATVAFAALVGCTTEKSANFIPPTPPKEAHPPHADQVPYKLGMARYTMCEVPLERAIVIMQACGCRYTGLIEDSIRFDATDAEIAAHKAKFAAGGIKVVSAGPLYYSTRDELEACCKFAKRYGMEYISVVPYEWNPKIAGCKTNDERRKILPESREWRVESDKAMDWLDECVKKYGLCAAVHNHGPDNAYLYPTAEAAMKRIGNRDKRIGVCLDVGHERRAGLDPVAFIRAHGDRVVEVHMKNIIIDPVKNYAMPGPDGELDIPGIMQALADAGFDGYCLVEYEKDFTCNEPALLRSFGYYRGCMDSVRAKPKMMPAPADANTLTDAEKKDGWKLLWDGKTSAGWVSAKNTTAFPDHGWVMKDGTLTMRPVKGISPEREWFPLPPEDQKLGGGGDIVTVKKYRNFEFSFDFRLTRAANSGVKYFVDEMQNGGSAEEYQILENVHPDSDKGKDGNRKTASLYDIIPAHADAIQKGVGQWNTGKIVSKGAHVEHWLNGVKVLEYERGGAAFRTAVKASKYADWGKTADGKPQPWGEVAEGRILLQDHSDSTVSFCNLKVREL